MRKKYLRIFKQQLMIINIILNRIVNLKLGVIFLMINNY